MKNRTRIHVIIILVSIITVFIFYSSLIEYPAISSQKESKIVMAFRNDDLSALSNPAHEEKIIEIFRKYNVSQTYGIVPNIATIDDKGNKRYALLTENPEMINKLRSWNDEGLIEIALHGYSHESENNLNEFAGLPYDRQFQKINIGKNLLETWFNMSVNVFVPPWGRYDDNTVLATLNNDIKIFSAAMLTSFPSKRDSLVTFVDSDLVLEEFDKFVAQLDEINSTVILVVLYHSWEIRTDEDFRHLERIVNSSVSNNITILKVSEIAWEYPDVLNNRKKVEPDVYKTRMLLKFYKLDGLYGKLYRLYYDGQYTLSKDFAIKSRYFVYLTTFLLTMILAGIITPKVKKRKYIIIFILGLLLLVLLVNAYFGFVISSPISTIDISLLLATFGLIAGFTINHFINKNDKGM